MIDIQPTDIAILLISLAAGIYCIVLNRRLRALQNTKNGLGATIVELSKSISAINSTTQDTRRSAEFLAATLAKKVSEANALCERLDTYVTNLNSSHSALLQQVENAHCELNTLSRNTIDQAGSHIVRMENLADRIESISHQTSEKMRHAVDQLSAPISRSSNSPELSHDLF